MRRWIVLALLLLVLGFCAIYLLLPNNTKFNERTAFAVNAKVFSRSLFDETAWAQWWPGTKTAESFVYNGNIYRIRKKQISSLVLSVQSGADSLQTELVVIPVGRDSIELNWFGTVAKETNPVARLRAMGQTKNIPTD